MRKFVICSSNTASNIGNDFFYKGIKFAFKDLLDVDLIDGYFYPFNAYHLSAAQRKNNLDYFSYVDGVDGIIIAGPVLDKNFGLQFGPAMENAKKNNVKIFLISAGGREYSEDEIAHCRKVLSKYSPDVFISRDSDTYDNYHDLCVKSYNGICFAFFLAEAFSGYKTDSLGQYISSVFDFTSEPPLSPFIESLKNGAGLNLTAHGTRSKIDRLKYRLQTQFSDEVHGYKVVRTCHRPMRPPSQMFFKKNIVASFSTDPYLNIYKNTSLTVTDRLHAAVATLAFGKPACLVLNSNRVKLLERAGVSGCINNIYTADLKSLEKERELQKSFLRGEFRNLFGSL